MSDNKKVIVFDLDGVIVDSVDIMYELTQGEFPDVTREEHKNLFKENIHDALKKTNLRRIEETPEHKAERHTIHSQNKLNVLLYPGVKEMLAKLAEENILTLNTSSSDEMTLRLLEKQGIEKFFSFVATSDVHKSKIEKFKMIAEKFEKEPTELLFVTDTVGDVKEAAHAGVPTIVVTWGLHTREDFAGAPEGHIVAFVDTTEELLEYIEKE